jgi:hypothetical protein
MKLVTFLVLSLIPLGGESDWKVLFDGKSTAGWRGYNQTKFPDFGWVVQDGWIKHLSREELGGRRPGDIVTLDEFGDFELELEYKVGPACNSGIKYLVVEDHTKAIGFEYQLLDDPNWGAKLKRVQATGALYDLVPAGQTILNPPGEINKVRIVVQGDRIEHWLNGAKVIEIDRSSEAFRNAVAVSKFKDIPGFGQNHRGHILLQDHGGEAWFRNIRIRELH